MKLPAFKHSDMHWDAWQAFHVVHKYQAFVQFDTGEFVVCSRRWSPNERCVYNDLGILIVATGDDDCPPLYVPGASKPTPKSHLNHKGMQNLLLDLTHKRAVSLESWLTEDEAPSIPARFTKHCITAYYAGPDATPVGAPITRYYPQPLEPHERRHVNSLVDASKVWLQMQSESEQGVLRREHRDVKVPVLDCVETSFATLTPAHRTAIALRGFETIIKEEHPWLTFDVE